MLRRYSRSCTSLLGLALAFPAHLSAQAPPLQPSLEEADPARPSLPEGVQPLLAQARDLGPADPDAPMERMILALKPPPGAEDRLERLLGDLHDPLAPDYHRWLTPDQFGAAFGVPTEGLERVAAWLQGEGFRIDQVAAGRLAVTFSGTVRQVERAFRTPIRRFRVQGVLRQANAAPPAIPGDLGDVVEGVVSLHDLPRRPCNSGFRAPGAGGKLAILGTWTNLDQGAGYLPCAVNMGAYLGQKVQLSFVASSYRYGRTTDFTLDDASLVAHQRVNFR